MPGATPAKASICCGLRRTSLVRSAALRSGLARRRVMSASERPAGAIAQAASRVDSRSAAAPLCHEQPWLLALLRAGEWKLAVAALIPDFILDSCFLVSYLGVMYLGVGDAQKNAAD